MTIKVFQFLKADLTKDSESIVTLDSTDGMTISHFAGSGSGTSAKSAQATLPFTVEGTAKHVPHIEDVEFAVVIGKRIDLKATGVNENIQKNIGEDIGEYDYKNNVPPRPLDLPPGFTELYKE